MTMRVIVMVRSENMLTPEEEVLWKAMSPEAQAEGIVYSETVLLEQMRNNFPDGPQITQVKVVYREDSPREIEQRDCIICGDDPEYREQCSACDGTGKVTE